MRLTDDSRLIAASILTLAVSINKISKLLDKRPVNDASARAETIEMFEAILADKPGKSLD